MLGMEQMRGQQALKGFLGLHGHLAVGNLPAELQREYMLAGLHWKGLTAD